MQGHTLGGTGTNAGEPGKGGDERSQGFREEGHSDVGALKREAFNDSTIQVKPGKLNPAVALPISAEEISLAVLRAWFTAVSTMSSNNWASAGLSACGSILIEAMAPSQRATTLTAPPPLVAST